MMAADEGTLTLAAAIAMGLVLAACAGLRAFLPLLALAVAGRTGVMPLAPELQWLASTPALVLLASAVFFEVLADKIPALDHVLDAIGLVARPLAGGAAAVIPFLSAGPDGSMICTLSEGHWGGAPWVAALTGFLAGGTVTALVQLAKAALRLASTALTGGLANPVVSLIEDGAGATGVVVAIVLPLAAIALAGAALLAATVWMTRRRSRQPA